MISRFRSLQDKIDPRLVLGVQASRGQMLVVGMNRLPGEEVNLPLFSDAQSIFAIDTLQVGTNVTLAGIYGSLLSVGNDAVMGCASLMRAKGRFSHTFPHRPLSGQPKYYVDLHDGNGLRPLRTSARHITFIDETKIAYIHDGLLRTHKIEDLARDGWEDDGFPIKGVNEEIVSLTATASSAWIAFNDGTIEKIDMRTCQAQKSHLGLGQKISGFWNGFVASIQNGRLVLIPSPV